MKFSFNEWFNRRKQKFNNVRKQIIRLYRNYIMTKSVRYVLRFIKHTYWQIGLIIIMALIIVYHEHAVWMVDHSKLPQWEEIYQIKVLMTGDGEPKYMPMSEEAVWKDLRKTFLKLIFQAISFVIILPIFLANLRRVWDAVKNVTYTTQLKEEDNYLSLDNEIHLNYLRAEFDVQAETFKTAVTKRQNPESIDIVKYVYKPKEKSLYIITKRMEDDLIEVRVEKILDEHIAYAMWMDIAFNNKVVTKHRYTVLSKKGTIYLDKWIEQDISILHLSTKGSKNKFKEKLLRKLQEINSFEGKINIPTKELAFYDTKEEILQKVEQTI